MTLPPLPVYPASARHSLCVAVPVPLPVLRGHGAHAALPVDALKWPAEQAVGVSPSGPVYPPFAAQAVTTVEPTTLLLLEGQSEQDVAVSVSVLYVPTPQFSHTMPLLFRPGPHSLTQAAPLGPLQPLLQLQAVAASLPAGLSLLSGQPVQDVAASVPILYVLASQFTQSVPLYFFPEPQLRQGEIAAEREWVSE